MLKQIDNDFYAIAKRLKQIYENYKVFYNTKTKLFEVYEVTNKNKTFLFVVGKNLNNLAIKKAFETSFRNFKNIFKNIEKTNFKIEKENNDRVLDYSKDLLNVYLNYANKKNCDVDFVNLFEQI